VIDFKADSVNTFLLSLRSKKHGSKQNRREINEMREFK
jgi:hypothetical protein